MDHAAPAQMPKAAGLPKVSLFILTGILLPAFTLGFEAVTHLSAESFFDPVPSIFHGVLVAFVPLSNLLLLVALSRPRLAQAHAHRLAWINALAIGIALFYTLLYLPLTPVAPILILWMGLGLLPLAPILSLAAAIRVRRVLLRATAGNDASRMPRVWGGVVLAIAALVAADMPFSVTRIGLHLAASPDAASRHNGIRLLRAVGNEDLMLRLCYGRSGMSTDLIGMLLASSDPVGTEQARAIFYQVTGTPFNDKPAPRLRTWRDWEMGFDDDRGSDRVGRRVEGVSLATSRIDGSIDAAATTGYLEWTLVFKNDSNQQQEGRGQIALPPGAVVSRVTLWIDGEEREAAFGGRAQVRQAYERVVRQQRDPVLVTTAGKDRVLFQLFPIQPRGEMKVRIGMTVPMVVTDLAQSQLQLPAFRERNFDIGPALRHELWLESSTALETSASVRQEHPEANTWALRGAIEDAALGKKASVVTARRDPAIDTAWTEDGKSEPRKIILQQYRLQAAQSPRHAVLVIDGSRSMAEARLQIAEALARIPSNIALRLVIAGDEPVALSNPGGVTAAAGADAIRNFDFAGGRSNLSALARAWDLASAEPDGVIVWIHGPQPLLLEPVEPLLQRFDRQPHRVRLIQFEALAGANRIAEKLESAVDVSVVPRLGTIAEDLHQLFGQWQPGARQVVVSRKSVSSHPEGLPHFAKTSDHLARLWAAERVTVAALTGKAAQREAATLLAQRYQLVTPLTGAVVLETRQQYSDAGLEPVAAGTVPTIPEPETWMLMFLVLSLLAWHYRRHRAGGTRRLCA